MRYLVRNSGPNRAQQRQAARQTLRDASAGKRKSATAKRMDRPHKMDAAIRGHLKIESFLGRLTV